jgi:hypothetical protein
LIVDDIRVFVPSKDLEASKEFYTDLGFTSESAGDDLIVFENGEYSFFLQRYYNKEFAENLMLQICVVDISAAFECANSARHKTKISGINTEPWGQVFYIWGPVGELLHVTQLVS